MQEKVQKDEFQVNSRKIQQWNSLGSSHLWRMQGVKKSWMIWYDKWYYIRWNSLNISLGSTLSIGTISLWIFASVLSSYQLYKQSTILSLKTPVLTTSKTSYSMLPEVLAHLCSIEDQKDLRNPNPHWQVSLSQSRWLPKTRKSFQFHLALTNTERWG